MGLNWSNANNLTVHCTCSAFMNMIHLGNKEMMDKAHVFWANKAAQSMVKLVYIICDRP